MNEQQHPYFIGIGPHKTASTWLHTVLKAHPEIQMPHVKEISYFYAKQVLKKPISWHSYLSENDEYLYTFYKKLFKNAWKTTKREIKKGNFDRTKFIWYLKFFALTQSDSWYLNLFKGSQKTGDVSPFYSFLNDDSIEALSKLCPNTKIIIGLRDPVERIWSALRMNEVKFKQKTIKEIIENQEVLRPYLTGKAWQTNDYVALVERWQKYYPSDRCFIYFYDELTEDPEALFQRICLFLGVEFVPNELISRKVFKGLELDMPSEIRSLFIQRNEAFVRKMIDSFDNPYPKQWLGKYKEYV